MKLNIFYGYSDCNPKDSSVEEIFQIIRQDARVKNRTENTATTWSTTWRKRR